MKNRFQDVLDGNYNNYIYPFFWQHGESHEILLEEIDRIRESKASAICIESRPHPGFLGEQWWSDMDLIMDQARRHNLKVWLLDDDKFPTGHSNGIFSGIAADKANLFLTNWCTDAIGPAAKSCMLVKPVLPGDGSLVAVVACPRVSGETTDIDLGKAVDLTGFVRNGWLRWDVPVGLWRIFIFYTTHHGEGKTDYFNIIDSQSVRLFLDTVYQPHYNRYKEDFGKTFMGFFSDEQEFGNVAGYDFQARLGRNMKFIPWSEELRLRLKNRWGGNFNASLPALWFEGGEGTSKIRYSYMDEVTRQLKAAFSDQVSDWCERHGVMHIGHIIEDDNSHGRLGCSTGHYFRSISGMGMAGIDVVLLQVMPGMTQTVHQWVASDRDGEFFHYGLGKMGSSLAHIDKKKNGNAMCEIFGAFGWQEGVSLMKWLADHMMSRGINNFVPHAFSPGDFPDSDCPPHFYARGNHPQFKYFAALIEYMNRISHLLSGGKYPAEAAVLYHADSEWAGRAMLFQKPVRALMERQLECDIVPADLFEEDNTYGMSFDGQIRVARQSYRVLVIPYCEYLPESVARFVIKAGTEGFPVLFVDGLPKGICESIPDEAELLKGLAKMRIVALEELAGAVGEFIRPIVRLQRAYPNLRTYAYENDYGAALYFFNEDIAEAVDTIAVIENRRGYCTVLRYDACENKAERLECGISQEKAEVRLRLEAGEAIILLLTGCDYDLPYYKELPAHKETIEGEWKISCCDIRGYPQFKPLAAVEKSRELPDLTDWAAEKGFCGILRYETVLYSRSSRKCALQLNGTPDAAEVFVNNKSAGKRIGMPYRFHIELDEGDNRLVIELASTPVWSSGDDWSSLTVLPAFGLSQKPVLYHP